MATRGEQPIMERAGAGASGRALERPETCPWCGAARDRDVPACPSCGSIWQAGEGQAGPWRPRERRRGGTDPLVIGAVVVLVVLALLVLGYLAWVGVTWLVLMNLDCGGANC